MTRTCEYPGTKRGSRDKYKNCEHVQIGHKRVRMLTQDEIDEFKAVIQARIDKVKLQHWKRTRKNVV